MWVREGFRDTACRLWERYFFFFLVAYAVHFPHVTVSYPLESDEYSYLRGAVHSPGHSDAALETQGAGSK